MLHTKFQTSEPSGPEEEKSKIFSYVSLGFESRTPWCWAILDPETFILTNLVKDH